ncbi:hypothetical protein BDW22DRAFT_1431719 [Trametopsis cervina]|nr:hypothetical protein BDW22DRAFT_1431719 [Trametopsis cervina]
MFSSLHAVVIGIDKYMRNTQVSAENNVESDGIGAPDLKGAVADADNVEDFLRDTLKVPSGNIVSLRNEGATRRRIISAISSLEFNPAIRRDDPILIYFAGHGGIAQPPEGWSDGNTEVQLLIPHDFTVDLNGGGVPGIPDRTLGSLLTHLAAAKGDNITVILDCCHSGSGTRDGKPAAHTSHASHSHLTARAISAKTTLHSHIDEDILRSSAASPGGHPVAHYGIMSSHVLVSACGASEEAFEDNGKGVFTEALLAAMPDLMEKKLTYYQLLEKMGLQLSKRGLRQNPQCEGFHKDRYIFDNKSIPPPHHFEATLHGETYKLSAGEIHGITASSQFKLANPSGDYAEKIMTVHEVHEFSATLKYPDGPPPSSALSQRANVFESSRGESNLLGLYFLAGDHDTIRLVEHEFAGILALTKDYYSEVLVQHNGGKVSFALPRLSINSAITPFSIPYTVDFVPEQLYRIARAMAHFRRHLTREPTKNIKLKCPLISVHFARIETTGLFHSPHLDRENLWHNDNLINVRTGTEYGLQLHNNFKVPLYVTVFLFDNDLSIRAYYLPGTTLPGGYKVDPCLKGEADLSIGYGSSGTSPFVFSSPRQSGKKNMCFVKIFVSTEQVDLSFIEQPSPFPKTVSPLIKKHPDNEHATSQDDTSSRGYKKTTRPESTPMWDAITLPVYVS